MQGNRTLPYQDAKNADLNEQLEDIGWGLLLIVIGGLLLVPGEQVPQGAWLILAGVIMLTLNGVRYLNGIRASVFTTALRSSPVWGASSASSCRCSPSSSFSSA